jgi:hypothetical protein
MDMISIMGWIFFLFTFLIFLTYFQNTRVVAKPYLEAKKSKGKKSLLLLDDGKGHYRLKVGKREALSLATDHWGAYEASDKAMKDFYGTSLGVGHCELEVLIPPEIGAFVRAHGGELTRDAVDSLPEEFSYFYCDKKIKNNGKEEICGWVSEAVPNDEKSVKGLFARLKKMESDRWKTKEEKDKTENPVCPKCGGNPLKIETKRTIYDIPNKTFIDLGVVKDWVDEVASPLNSDMRVQLAMSRAREKYQDRFVVALQWMTILMIGLLAVGVFYKLVTGGGVPGMESAKEVVGGIKM